MTPAAAAARDIARYYIEYNMHRIMAQGKAGRVDPNSNVLARVSCRLTDVHPCWSRYPVTASMMGSDNWAFSAAVAGPQCVCHYLWRPASQPADVFRRDDVADDVVLLVLRLSLRKGSQIEESNAWHSHSRIHPNVVVFVGRAHSACGGHVVMVDASFQGPSDSDAYTA